MEENCLAEEAYRMRRENPNFTLETRRLLRFTTSIENIGDADFRPFIPKSAWQWHACHMHYHSMEVRKQLSSDNLLTLHIVCMYPPQCLKITFLLHILKLRSNTFSTHRKYISNIYVRKALSLHDVAYTC